MNRGTCKSLFVRQLQDSDCRLPVFSIDLLGCTTAVVLSTNGRSSASRSRIDRALQIMFWGLFLKLILHFWLSICAFRSRIASATTWREEIKDQGRTGYPKWKIMLAHSEDWRGTIYKGVRDNSTHSNSRPSLSCSWQQLPFIENESVPVWDDRWEIKDQRSFTYSSPLVSIRWGRHTWRGWSV